MEPKWGLDLAINGNGWKQTASDDLIKSVCYLPLLAVVFRYLPTLLPYGLTQEDYCMYTIPGDAENPAMLWLADKLSDYLFDF